MSGCTASAARDAIDPTETWAAQDFRSAKVLFVPSLKRDIVPSIACTRPPAGGVAWQSTSDGENSYSHWAARRLLGRSRRARSSMQGQEPANQCGRARLLPMVAHLD